jgi:hypothetical protein
MPATHSPFALWESFYVIVGSSAAALTGLQFVVIVLGAETNISKRATTSAFGTPTVVHFSAVLLISALLSAPWRGITPVAICLGSVGFVGLIFVINVLRAVRGQREYEPVLEDWLGHVIAPALAYVGTIAAALMMVSSRTELALFVVGAAAIVLLFAGIHNAWDAVTFIAHLRGREDEAASRVEGSEESKEGRS